MVTFSIQGVVYIIFNLGLPILSPISLPLVSYGNASTIINLLLIGLMLSIFRTNNIHRDGKIYLPAPNNKMFSWHDGKLIIDFKS